MDHYAGQMARQATKTRGKRSELLRAHTRALDLYARGKIDAADRDARLAAVAREMAEHALVPFSPADLLGTKSPAPITEPGLSQPETIMSRSAAKKTKPSGRGGKRENSGRNRKYDDGVPMLSKTITMREDVWEIVLDEAERQGLTRGEWIQRRILPPALVAALDRIMQD